MTTSDPIPSAPQDPNERARVESERRLYDTLVAPFERPFTSFGYHTQFSFFPNPERLNPENNETLAQLSRVTSLTFSPSRAWSVELGHDPQSDHLAPTRVEIPVHTHENTVKLVLQRLIGMDSYLLLYKQSDDADDQLFNTVFDRFEKDVSGTNESYAYALTFVDDLLKSIGYVAPETHISANDIQHQVARSLDTADSWRRKEVIEIPLSPDRVATLTRTSIVSPSRQFNEADGTYTRHSDGEVVAVIRRISPRGDSQFTIKFTFLDHSVLSPEISRQLVFPARDAESIASHGPDAVRVKDLGEIYLSADELDSFAEELTLLF